MPDQVVPTSSLIQHKTKEEVTKIVPHLQIINQSKLANLIIEKDKYKVMMMAVPLLSQLVEVKSVVHHSVRSVSRDKNWAALGLVGKKEKHGDTTLGYIRSFGVDNKWEVDMEGLAGSNTIHFIHSLFTEVKSHIKGASNLSVKTVSLIIDNHEGVEVPHYSEFFDVAMTKKKQFGWSVEVPLCAEGSVIFLYNDSENNIKFQKIHIPFGCALIIRSDVLNGGYGGKKGSLRLRGTFHTKNTMMRMKISLIILT